MSESIMYAASGSAAFNRDFGKALSEYAASIKSRAGDALAGLVLCGGYGRGEGAVARRPSPDDPNVIVETGYNDVDILPVAESGGIPRLTEALASCEEERKQFELRWQVDLDIGRPLERGALATLPASLMWIEVARGHLVLEGKKDLFSSSISFSPDVPVPPVEAARLLVNRGTGLLIAARKAAGQPPSAYDCSDPDFVRRNWMKCRLALGDAACIAAGCHVTPVEDKAEAFVRAKPKLVILLSRAPGRRDSSGKELFAELEREYRAGIAFKLDPDSQPDIPAPALLATQAALWLDLFLATESARGGRTFSGVVEYALWNGVREVAENSGMRNLARNLVKNLARRKFSFRYPREELYRRLPLLLEPQARSIRLSDPGLKGSKHPERQFSGRAAADSASRVTVKTTNGDIGQEIESYLELWKRYN